MKTAAKKVAAPKALSKKTVAKKSPAKKVAAKAAPAMKEAAKRPAPPPRKMKEAAKRVPDKPKNTGKKISAVTNDGIVFPDPGFHLAVLGALMEMKWISAELIQATLEGLDFDDDASEDERLLAAMARLHTLKLDPERLKAIESVDFDGGNEIYMLLEDGAGTETGGEADTYELKAITGISALSGLKTLCLDGHGYRAATLDLKPLEGHPALEHLILSGKCKPATVLETLPKLARLDLGLAKLDRPAVLERLVKKGVDVARDG
ncbi:MAG TPA: hypothetical protein PKA58_06510 [Polyangium sp.]|nr:hypothetical protein [Polyangium sp.]